MSFVWQAKERMMLPEQVARQIHAVSLERGLDELASVLALMCVSQESNFWCPWNERVPESRMFSHDSQSDDNRSMGYLQQQPGPAGEPWWGSTRDMMTLPISVNMFLERLTDDYRYALNNPRLANDYIANVQRPHPKYRGAYEKHWNSSWELLRRALAQPVPLPVPEPPRAPKPIEPAEKPNFQELERYGHGSGQRRRAPINFFIHTEQGNADAEGLARYCDGSNNVSYHYTLRDRILCDVVRPSDYSWSVLNANVFSLNLCFAGSYAEWSRDEWMKRRDDIEIAAYVAVRDCRRFGIPCTVIMPPYSEMPGISDHRYVTMELGIGTHTDVGGSLGPPWTGFPWDLFVTYVAKYSDAALEVPPMAGQARSDRQLLEEVWDKVTAGGGRYSSRAMTRDTDDGIDDGFGMVLNSDANAWDMSQMILALLTGEPNAIARWRRLANGYGPAAANPELVRIAQAVFGAVSHADKKAAEDTKAVGEP